MFCPTGLGPVFASRDELNSRCRCTDIHTPPPTLFTTSTPGKMITSLLGSLTPGGVLKETLVCCEFIYLFFLNQGSMGAQSSRGSELSAPTCRLGKTRTPAGEPFKKMCPFIKDSTDYMVQIHHTVPLLPHCFICLFQYYFTFMLLI